MLLVWLAVCWVQAQRDALVVEQEESVTEYLKLRWVALDLGLQAALAVLLGFVLWLGGWRCLLLAWGTAMACCCHRPAATRKNLLCGAGNTYADGLVPYSQVLAQIQALNQAYKSAGFKFVLAGTDR